MSYTEREKESAVRLFLKVQTLTNIQKIKNKGMEVQRLKDGQWTTATTYDLPEKAVPLYNDELNIEGIGFY